MKSVVEVDTQNHQASIVEIQKLYHQRKQIIGLGFTACDLLIPTRDWHGTRVEAHIDLVANECLPFLHLPLGHNRLTLATLSCISFELGSGTPMDPCKFPVLLSDQVRLHSEVPIHIDNETKEALRDFATQGEELARRGFGYLGEFEWLKPIEDAEEPIRISAKSDIEHHSERASSWLVIP